MRFVKNLDSSQRISLGLVLILEICILLSIAQSNILAELTPQRLMLMSGLQTLLFVGGIHAIVLLIVLAILFKRLPATAVTLSLLLFANFLVTPLVSVSSDFVTLPKNMDRKLRIVGDVMPGFTGISKITTDEKGFRTTKAVDYNSESGLRIFAIGGSTTEQLHISDEKTWTALLQDALGERSTGQVEVINTGVAGLRARHHHATLVEILDYSPDIVIFMMGLNDWNRHIVDHFASRFSNVNDSLNFAVDKSILWRSMRIVISYLRTPEGSKIDDGVEEFDGAYYSTQNDSLARSDVRAFGVEDVSDDYHRWVQEIVDTCVVHDVQCVFLNQPTAYQPTIDPEIKRRLWMTPPNQRYTLSLEGMMEVSRTYNQWLLRHADDQGLISCDLASHVPPSTMYFYDDCHFNEGGARLVAELVERCLEPLI